MNPYKNVQVRFSESERRLLLDIESFEQIFYLFFIEIAFISIEVVNVASNSFMNIKTASFFKDRSQLFNLFHIGHTRHLLSAKMLNQHQPTATNIQVCLLQKSLYCHFNVSHHKNHKIQRDSDMGIHMNHLSLFVVGGGDIFVSNIAVFSKSIESRIEVLCRREKIASAGVVEVGLQAMFDILGLEDLDYLLSLDDVPVGSVHAETIYRLIAIVVSYIKSPQQCVMIYTFLGRLNTSGTAVGTMKNTGYPKYQTMKLSAPVLTAAHGFLDLFFDIVVAVFDILLGSVAGQVQYHFLSIVILFSFQELMNEIMILLPDFF